MEEEEEGKKEEEEKEEEEEEEREEEEEEERRTRKRRRRGEESGLVTEACTQPLHSKDEDSLGPVPLISQMKRLWFRVVPWHVRTE